MEIRRSFTARTYDVDFAGIVSNIVYVRWLEDLRLALLDATVPLDQLLARGICPVVARTEIDYRRSLRLGEVVEGVLRVLPEEQRGATSILRFWFTRLADGGTVAEARQVIAAVNLTTGRAVRLPPDYRRAVAALQDVYSPL